MNPNTDLKALVIIPTYNERMNITQMIDTVNTVLPGLDMLVIDDGSPDGTAQVVKDKQGKKSNLHLLERQGKLGLGTAYITGFKWALERDYQKIISMDCDFSHDPAALPQMIEQLDKNDLVVGSRYINGIRIINWPMKRLLLSYFASVYARIVTGIPFFDATGGFTGYSRQALASLKLDQVFSKGYCFQIELKFKVWSKNLKCFEMPIIFSERTEGVSKMSQGIIFEAVIGVIRLRLKKIMGTL